MRGRAKANDMCKQFLPIVYLAREEKADFQGKAKLTGLKTMMRFRYPLSSPHSKIG
jgi:hypothetical protein